jgi:hypothetical protein
MSTPQWYLGVGWEEAESVVLAAATVSELVSGQNVA